MSMAIIIPMAIVVSALIMVIIIMLLGALIISTGKVNEINKQLMILVAGKDAKPEALRALVASAKPPKKNLPGISGKKKDDKGPKNTNYTLEVGA